MRFCNDSLLRTPHGILDGNTLNMRMNTILSYAMDELSKHEGIDVDMGDIDNIGQFLGKLMTTGTKDIPPGWNGQKPEELQDYDETTHSWGALYDEGDRDEKQQKEYDNIASQITNPVRKDKSGRYGRKYKTEMPSNMAQALAFYPAMFVGGEKTAKILSSVDKGRKGKDSIVNDELEQAGYSKTSVDK